MRELEGGGEMGAGKEVYFFFYLIKFAFRPPNLFFVLYSERNVKKNFYLFDCNRSQLCQAGSF